jgi:chemotaxis protein histidine kinase CheA
MGKFRDGAPASSEAVTLILSTIDRIKGILDSLEREQREPEGGDTDLISSLERMVERVGSAGTQAEAEHTVGTLVAQILERPLQPDEDSLDDLERAFRDTNIDPQLVKSRSAPALDVGAKDDDGKGASQSIRVTVDTLEHLMTMVSELVLTRNQLLEIVRRHEESEFKTPLQRLSNVTAELQEGVMKTRMQPIGNAWAKLPRLIRTIINTHFTFYFGRELRYQEDERILYKPHAGEEIALQPHDLQRSLEIAFGFPIAARSSRRPGRFGNALRQVEGSRIEHCKLPVQEVDQLRAVLKVSRQSVPSRCRTEREPVGADA